ncbi:MAG TPA: Coq4 family protein [Candidatus Dormibacteraeota bacterium]|nr:Coq4 family protein [Candidatus Dormibacteraeota bacterium]
MINAHENVLAARDRYLAASGFSTASYTDPNFVVGIGFIKMRFPNPGLLPYHDLHHVATGYDSSLLGEAEISVFEFRNGAGTPLIFFLCCGSILVGLCLSPRRMWRAWKAAKGAHSLYGTNTPYETLLAMDVATLRKTMALESQ